MRRRTRRRRPPSAARTRGRRPRTACARRRARPAAPRAGRRRARSPGSRRRPRRWWRCRRRRRTRPRRPRRSRRGSARPVPNVLAANASRSSVADQPEPARRRHLDDRTDASADRELRLDRAPERIGDGRRSELGAERRGQRLERPLAAVGDRAQVDRRARRLEARGRSRRPPRAAVNVPLNESGATRIVVGMPGIAMAEAYGSPTWREPAAQLRLHLLEPALASAACPRASAGSSCRGGSGRRWRGRT